jgi:hypothetical protein
VTAWQWIVGLLLTLGGVAMAVAKADLEDPDVYRWLVRKLIYRAALRLPREERARWREESMQNVLDLPGRLPPLVWALDTYVRSGSWARTRGASSRWQALVARIRAAWQRLRSLPEERARARSKERHPASSARAQRQDEVGHVVATATVTARNATRSTGSATLGYSPEVAFARYRKSLLHLSDEEVVTLLSQSPQEFVADLDRRVEEWRRERWRLLGREPE